MDHCQSFQEEIHLLVSETHDQSAVLHTGVPGDSHGVGLRANIHGLETRIRFTQPDPVVAHGMNALCKMDQHAAFHTAVSATLPRPVA